MKKLNIKRVMICLIPCLLIIIAVVWKVIPQDNNTKVETTNEIKKEEKKKIQKTSITLSFAGDITMGNYVGQGNSGTFNQMYESVDPSYFLRNVKSVFEKDDLTIANMEGPITTASKYAIKKFAFKGKPEYRNILKLGGVDVVTLANNHSQDYFDQGMKDTKDNLDQVDIAHFGYNETTIQEVKGKKIGFIGLSFPQEYGNMTKKLLEDLKEKTDLIVLYVHWGIERDEAPMSSQVDLAHRWIDEGVDLVIGSHPHVVQGIETYKGKKIVYSLGNFCFGGNKNPSDKDSMIYQHTFEFEGDKIIKESSNVIPCSISSSSSRNNYQPTILKGSEKSRVEKKIEKRSQMIN